MSETFLVYYLFHAFIYFMLWVQDGKNPKIKLLDLIPFIGLVSFIYRYLEKD